MAVDIMVVEDDRTTLKLISSLLTNLGHEVSGFASAEEGLKVFDKNLYEVVIADVELPGMNGLEMVRRIHEVDPMIAPIVMTSRVDQEVAIEALECGSRAFLKKPVAQDELQTKLEAILRQRTQLVEMRLLMGDLIRKRGNLQETVQEQYRKLVQTERYLQHLIDAAPFAIISTDMEDVILTFSGRAEQMYGYAEGDIIGRPLSVLSDTGQEMVAASKETHRNSAGDGFPVLVHQREVLDDDGRCIARLHAIEDLSEREQMENQLFYAERLSLLGQLAPRISHEFKTPMQLITGYAELAKEILGRGEVEQGIEYVEMIGPASKQVLDMVQQIADIGKPKESRQEAIDLADDVEKLLDALQHLGAVKHCQMDVDFGRPLPKIQGDRAQIEQVFRNLIINAAHAMEGTAERVLSVHLQPTPEGDRVEALIGDTGSGISPEKMETIFQPFYTTKEEGKGTGLGLAIVKTAVERHQATIRVESELEVGTQIHLSFPAIR